MNPKNMSDKALTIAQSRYFLEEEDWESCSLRVASTIATPETTNAIQYRDAFQEMIYNMDFLPGGRILRNCGRPRGSLFNCYHLPVGDSIEQIGQLIKDSLILWSEGGGVGINFSTLRPKGDPILGKGGESSGLVSFMEATDGIAKTVESGGSRRAAALGHVEVSHPEIMQFIDAKMLKGTLSHFNISVAVTEDFLEAVEKGDDWEFKFKNKSYGSVPAKLIWDKIVTNMVDCAEPGLMNWNNFQKNNSYYFAPVKGTNPCQPKWATVLTPSGISTIGNINIGDQIWSEDGWVKVINKIHSGVKDVNRYRTNASVFYGTENHRIKSNNEKIEVKDATSIDTLRGMYLDAVDDINPQDVMDGLVIGDGMIHKASNNLITLLIGENDHDYFDSEIKDLILCHRPGIKETAYEIKTSISANELDLTYDRRVPDRFKFGSVSKMLGFLRGYFTANGSVINKPSSRRVGIKASSNKLIEDIQIMLSSIGIKSYITTDKARKTLFGNGEYLCRESYAINITTDCDKFLEYIGFIQLYKQTTLTELVTEQKETTYEKMTFDINEISYISTEDVYDITVDGPSHTYWSGGCNVSNCGETTLEEYGVCCLGSIVLPNFITNVNTNWKKLEQTIKLAIRFLDNVIDCNKYTLEQIDFNAHRSRRIGLGVMGMAEYLFAKKLRYGSKKAVHEVERLMRFIRDTAYIASMELAIEKGTFPAFESIPYSKASFIRKLPANLRMSIKNNGIRNTTCLALAPTGTISLLAECSSGIEPLFSKAYDRSDRVSKRLYVHPIYEDIIKNGESIPDWFVDAYDLSPQDHFEMQCICQKYIDGSVSKTINLPNETTSDQLSNLLLEYIHDLKGVTVYRDGSREGQILTQASHEDVLEYIDNNQESSERSNDEVRCAKGTCEI